MRDQDHSVRIFDQVRLEPVARLEIQVVRRLVQEQQVRLAEQELRQGDPHLPAARKRLCRPAEIVIREAEALKHRRRFQVDAVAAAEPEPVLEIAVARQHRIVLRLRDRLVAQPRLERVHLVLHGDQVAEGAAGFVEDASSCVRQAVLRQIADGQRRRLQNRTRIPVVEPRHHSEQRGFAGAVRTAQANPLPVGNLPGDVLEEHTVAERFGEILKLDHAEEKRLILARARRVRKAWL